MSLDEARDYYLAQKTYFVHARAQAHQERFLVDLSKRNRAYVRTRSGVTYKIEELGDQSHQSSMGARDTVKLVYTMRRENGEVVVERDTIRESYRSLLNGLQEVVRIAGNGGKFDAWLPSKTAYDSAGDSQKGIGANELLNIEAEILDIKYYNTQKRR
jgi:FKBP-type peptidyl-prolyl cis-trans isomerase FkpA